MLARLRFLVVVASSVSQLLAADRHPDSGEPLLAVSFMADFGADRGQSFGALFEARDAAGRVVAGAGYADAYNTRFRGDRHRLQFFVRPTDSAARYTLERLPHPDLDCGVYLLDADQTLYAWSSTRGNSLRRWNDEKRQWTDEPPEGVQRLRSGDGVMRLGSGRLVFANDSVTYNGQAILSPPARGEFYNFYYAFGSLFFYHTDRTETNGFTRIYACSWAPESAGPIDLANAVVLNAKYVGETPFGWGQFSGSVMTVSNLGGVYTFDKGDWKVLREPDKAVSFQVYSMMHFYDRLLLAQYPTGEIFEFQGQSLKRREGWPPRLPGVSGTSRESQTLGIYGGDLFIGVWPWAELWRYDRDRDGWNSHGRMFTHPGITSLRTHPYEPESQKFGLIANHWGQRVTGIVPLGDSLMISTSAKGTSEWDAKYDFLTDAQRREYGAVLRLRSPGNLAVVTEWKDAPTRFEFLIYRDRMLVKQDGKILASSKLSGIELPKLQGAKVTLGAGVYGQFGGKITASK